MTVSDADREEALNTLAAGMRNSKGASARLIIEDMLDALIALGWGRPVKPSREALSKVLYAHSWNGRACDCGWNMYDHPEMWNNHAADALLADEGLWGETE